MTRILRFVEFQVTFPVPHPIYIAPDFITAVEENRINENSTGSIIHMGESSFIVADHHHDVIERL